MSDIIGSDKQSNPVLEDFLSDIRAARSSGDLKTAAKRSLEYCMKYPEWTDTYGEPVFLKEYVLSVLEMGDFDTAKGFLRDVFGEKLPLWCNVAIGRVAVRNGNVYEAIHAYKTVANVVPKSTEAVASLTKLAIRHNSAPAAMALLEICGDESEISQPIMADLSRIFHRTGNTQLAGSLFSKAHGITCRIVQTSDSNNYFPMIMETLKVNRLYANLVKARYECYLGVHSGYHPWHATFNRIPMLKQMLDEGYYGWVLYIDADAYVVDTTFDLKSFLEENNDFALIAASGSGKAPWDINIGVFFINLGIDNGRNIVEKWYHEFNAVLTDSVLIEASAPWKDIPNDQSILQGILRDNPRLISGLKLASNKFINSSTASFIRQNLRKDGLIFADRLKEIKNDVSIILENASRRTDN